MKYKKKSIMVNWMTYLLTLLKSLITVILIIQMRKIPMILMAFLMAPSEVFICGVGSYKYSSYTIIEFLCFLERICKTFAILK